MSSSKQRPHHHATFRRKFSFNYPNSSQYWLEYDNPRKLIDVGVQYDYIESVQDLHPLPPPIPKVIHIPTNIIPKAPPTVVPEVAKISLSQEQQRVLDMVKSGRNVFFTGPAGTGKSVLLREIIRQLRTSLEKEAVAITAPTGIAGLNIDGSTIHSFAGIGLGKESAERLAKRIRHSERFCERWCKTKILIIDEISMLDANLFDKLEYIARYVRKQLHTPFGGIQLVLSGDFFQLPPVPEKSHAFSMPATYAFDAETWSRCISKPVFLSQVFRQTDDSFISILTSMRMGKLTAEQITVLSRLSRPLTYSDGIEPSHLFPLRKQVEGCNSSRLNALEGESHVYRSADCAGYDVHDELLSRDECAPLLDRLVAPALITLKIGAQVMLIQNVVQGALVNGSVGKVVDFLTTSDALKRHIEIASIRPRESKPYEDEYLTNMRKYRGTDRILQPLDSGIFNHRQSWPVVRFTNNRELLCAPLEFSVVGCMGNIEVSRLQVPLILAWALSIHKSQGQTLTRVKVDMGHIFEKGQAYVALSRATTMENLEVQNFSPSRVQAHPHVLRWHEFWAALGQNSFEDEMDGEEAISHFWDLSD